MATTYWIGNQNKIAQVDTITITAVGTPGTISVTIGTKTMTYTLLSTDTTTSIAASSIQAALVAFASTVPEFSERSWTVSSNVITSTDVNPGFFVGPISKGQSGSATCTLATTVTGTSPFDANDAANWLRNGTNALPTTNDDVVFQNSSVPVLYNVNALTAVAFNSLTRYQSYTGQIGLPDINVNGYYEYRPTYFKFTGPNSSSLGIVAGLGSGTGPVFERYNPGTTQAAWTIQAGSTVNILNTNALSTLLVLNATVSVAAGQSETSTLASATVDGGGSLTLGTGVTMAGAFTVSGGSATTFCIPGSITASNGATVVVGTTGGTFTAITGTTGSTFFWQSNSNITTLTLSSSSALDKSSDPRTMTITNSTIEGDTCQVRDPLSTITWTNASSVSGLVSTGPFTFLGTRTVKIT